MEHVMFEGPAWPGSFKFSPTHEYEWAPRKGFRVFFSREFWRYVAAGGLGGDEYGNCSLYFRCPLFGIVWFYPTGHYQTDIEIPEYGENPWVDRVYYEEA